VDFVGFGQALRFMWAVIPVMWAAPDCPSDCGLGAWLDGRLATGVPFTPLSTKRPHTALKPRNFARDVTSAMKRKTVCKNLQPLIYTCCAKTLLLNPFSLWSKHSHDSPLDCPRSCLCCNVIFRRSRHIRGMEKVPASTAWRCPQRLVL